MLPVILWLGIQKLGEQLPLQITSSLCINFVRSYGTVSTIRESFGEMFEIVIYLSIGKYSLCAFILIFDNRSKMKYPMQRK